MPISIESITRYLVKALPGAQALQPCGQALVPAARRRNRSIRGRLPLLTFYITIDPAGHDYLRRTCTENDYLAIGDVTALPGRLSKVYRTLRSTL